MLRKGNIDPRWLKYGVFRPIRFVSNRRYRIARQASGSTVLEHLPRHLEVKGLSPATRRE
jgi:hypothetical protein